MSDDILEAKKLILEGAGVPVEKLGVIKTNEAADMLLEAYGLKTNKAPVMKVEADHGHPPTALPEPEENVPATKFNAKSHALEIALNKMHPAHECRYNSSARSLLIEDKDGNMVVF